MTGETPTVLIVDDQEDVATVYSLALSDDYDVEIAHDGEAALATMAETDVDVVLLDRLMPGPSGAEVLTSIRERHSDVGVVAVTAVDPDFDVADLSFDAYLTKPVDDADLREAVASVYRHTTSDTRVGELASVAERLGVLDTEKAAHERETSEEYQTLRDRLVRLATAHPEAVDELDAEARAVVRAVVPSDADTAETESET